MQMDDSDRLPVFDYKKLGYPFAGFVHDGNGLRSQNVRFDGFGIASHQLAGGFG